MGTVYVFTKEGVVITNSSDLEISDYPMGTYSYFASLNEFPWSISVNKGDSMLTGPNWWNDLTPEEVPAEIRAQLLLVM